MQNAIFDIPRITEECSVEESQNERTSRGRHTQPITIAQTKNRPIRRSSKSFDEGCIRGSEKYACKNRNVTSYPGSPQTESLVAFSFRRKYSPRSKLSVSHSSEDDKVGSESDIARFKGAGVIPYTIVDDNIYFLMQHAETPCKKKDMGWNDFGGKKNLNESIPTTAAREFSEETSCLFYLKENDTPENIALYDKLKNNSVTKYSNDTIQKLTTTIPLAQKYFANKIDTATPYLCSRDTYLSYFIKVKYLPAKDIPISEDLHIAYIERYTRSCKWFTYEEIMGFNAGEFHKRLQITKIKHNIKSFYETKKFV